VDSQSRDLAITPDGSHIIYKGGSRSDRTQLFVRGLDQLDPVPLTPPGRPKGPFASPDGRWIGFFVPGRQGPGLKKVAISGGAVVDIAQLDGASRGAAWAEDGSIILATAALDTGIQRVPPSGGAPEILTRPARDRGEGDHLFPQLLPGGKAVLFTVTTLTGAADGAQVAILDLESRTWRTLIRGGSQAQYLPSGHLVYVAGGALWAIPFDRSSMETRGTARVVVPQVLTLPNGTAEFDVAQNGTLVYVTGTHLPPQRSLVWVDRAGREELIDAAPRRPYSSVRLSPDGTTVALEIDDEENDIWVWHVARQVMARVTDDPGLDESPIWTPDGHHLIFTSQAEGALGSLFRKAADGSGALERLTTGTSVQRPWAVLPDGSGVLFDEFSALMLLSLADRHQQPLLHTPQIVRSGSVSHDGRWIAYVGGDTGVSQIFVRPYPNVDDAKTQASIDGGSQPIWARNGRELLFLGPGGTLMSAGVGPHGIDGSAPPRPVLQQRYFEGAGLTSPRTFDVSPDGARFLMIKTPGLHADPAAAVRVVVVLNWTAELGRIAPR
jgi:serine/threonine-protein kinase